MKQPASPAPSSRRSTRSPRDARPVDPGSRAPAGVIALQRAAGNRAVTRLIGRRTLARTPAEQQFALSHEGQVASTQRFVGGVPQEAETDLDEFVLWNFLVDSTVVRRGHKKGIDDVARRWATELTANPLLRIRVLGYASVTGGTALNEDLARRRAEAVRDHLADLGVPEDQIVIDSSGSRLPMDEGDSPESLARNRRVEISKFVATTVKGATSDLSPGLGVFVPTMEISFSDPGVLRGGAMSSKVTDDEITLKLAPTVVQARVLSTAVVPGVEVGMVQFITSDVRKAKYREPAPTSQPFDTRQPVRALADWGHCLNAFTPCRDVRFARRAFSGDPSLAVTTPSPAGDEIFFTSEPEAVFPLDLDVEDVGPSKFSEADWSTEFTVVVFARKDDLVVPLRFGTWSLRSNTIFQGSVDSPKLRIEVDRNATTPLTALGPPPGIDIERAMSMPTATLRERMMNQLCKPTITPVTAGFGGDVQSEPEPILLPPGVL
jgi:outer membrane protein OmpA-like peptidoglycan-associated protein